VLDIWKRSVRVNFISTYSYLYRASSWLSRYISCIHFDEQHIFACLDAHRLATGIKLRSVWVRLPLKLRSYQSEEISSLPGEGFPLLLRQKFQTLFSLLVLLISWKFALRIHSLVDDHRWFLLVALWTLPK